jgi:hypothetical protein
MLLGERAEHRRLGKRGAGGGMVLLPPSGPGSPRCRGFTCTFRHHTRWDPSGTVFSPTQILLQGPDIPPPRSLESFPGPYTETVEPSP